METQQNEFEIKKYKSLDKSTYINIYTFSFEDRIQSIPAYYRINNVIFNSVEPHRDFSIKVLEGMFKIQAGFIAKEEVEIREIKIEKGDSIVLKIFLKDDSEPLH